MNGFGASVGVLDLLDSTVLNSKPHSEGSVLLKLLAPLHGAQQNQQNLPTTLRGGLGLTAKSRSQAVHERRIPCGPVRLSGNGAPVPDHPVDGVQDRGPVAIDHDRESLDGQSFGVIAKRGEDDGVKRRRAMQWAMIARPRSLLGASTPGSIHLLPDVARSTSGDEVVHVIGAAFADWSDMVNVQDDVWRELSAVAAGELVTFQDGPPNDVPLVDGLACVSHMESVPQFTQLAQFYQIQDTVR